MAKQILNKTIIIGEACRGKTALASIISKKYGIAHYSTDDYFYEVKFTKRRDRQKSIDDISKIYHGKRWIVEGTTRHLLEPGIDSADLIIFLRYKNALSQCLNLIKRHFIRKDESFLQTLRLIKHVVYKRYQIGYKKGTITHSEFIAPYKHKVITLSSFKEINDFVDSL